MAVAYPRDEGAEIDSLAEARAKVLEELKQAQGNPARRIRQALAITTLELKLAALRKAQLKKELRSGAINILSDEQAAAGSAKSVAALLFEKLKAQQEA